MSHTDTRDTSRFAGKVVVVTGASKGIGAATARAFGAEGAAVVVNYATSRAGADAVVADVTARGGRAIAVQGDVARREDVERLFDAAIDAFGRVDVLVNNAGVFALTPLPEVTEAEFHRQYGTNVLGLLLATQEAVRRMGDAGGSVVNVSSTVSTVPYAGFSVYAGTKAAVDVITRVLAQELGPRGIRVNAVNPGMVLTEGVRTAGLDAGDLRAAVEASTALGRVGETADVVPTILFLASDAARWVTGETLRVNGGLKG